MGREAPSTWPPRQQCADFWHSGDAFLRGSLISGFAPGHMPRNRSQDSWPSLSVRKDEEVKRDLGGLLASRMVLGPGYMHMSLFLKLPGPEPYSDLYIKNPREEGQALVILKVSQMFSYAAQAENHWIPCKHFWIEEVATPGSRGQGCRLSLALSAESVPLCCDEPLFVSYDSSAPQEA